LVQVKPGTPQNILPKICNCRFGLIFKTQGVQP